MPIASCQICGRYFYVKPNRLQRGWGKYCSNQCKHEGKKSGKMLTCSICGKSIYKNNSTLSRSRSGKHFCGKSCQTIWRNTEVFIGEKHANWKDGEASYRHILARQKAKQVCAKCHTADVRILAVHHKDKNRKNNHPVNLMWLCHNCHHLVHHYPSEAKGFLIQTTTNNSLA